MFYSGSQTISLLMNPSCGSNLGKGSTKGSKLVLLSEESQ